jgi:superfamily II DNA or RNA helicase
MLKFRATEDLQWLLLIDYTEEVDRKQLEISLTKKIHNHFFHPLVKKKHWDGSICFVDKRGPVWRVPSGLWAEVFEICEKYKIEVEIEGLDRIIEESLTLEDFTSWCDEFFSDKELKPRDYQIEAAWRIVKFRQSVLEIATSSGKTLIAFIVLAYLKRVKRINKFLMIVPTTQLVMQGAEDFEEYGLKDLDDCQIQLIHGGNKNKIPSGLMIGTYQSLVKQDDSFYEGVEAIFVDESHQTHSKSIKEVVSKCKDSRYRFGLSGTLTNRNSAEYLTIQQFLGPLIMEISPKFLFDNKYATPVNIKIVKMDWVNPDIKEKLYELRQQSKKKSDESIEGNEIFNIERKLVVSSDLRLDYVTQFILKTSKNSLVLYQSVGDGYGRRIYDKLRELQSEREVFYIDGDTEPERRDYYKKQMEEGTNKILVASFGTLSTGVSIKNIHNIFLTESYKSEVLIKQSLGRGMRLYEGKEKVNIIDFVDDFSHNSNANYLLKHCFERIEIYKREKFDYKIYEVKL